MRNVKHEKKESKNILNVVEKHFRFQNSLHYIAKTWYIFVNKENNLKTFLLLRNKLHLILLKYAALKIIIKTKFRYSILLKLKQMKLKYSFLLEMYGIFHLKRVFTFCNLFQIYSSMILPLESELLIFCFRYN